MRRTISLIVVTILLAGGTLMAAQDRDDLSRLAALHQQAAAAQNAGQYEEAERLHRAVLEGMERVPGFPINEQARQLSNLASVVNLRDQPDEALSLLRRAEDLLARDPSQDPAQYATLHGNFAEAYARQQRWTEAEQRWNQSIAVLQRVGVTDRMYYFQADRGLGYVYWKTGRLTEARQRYEAALEIVRQISPPSHPVRHRWEEEYQSVLMGLRD